MTAPDPDIERALNGDGAAAAELVATLAPVIRRRVTSVLTQDNGRRGRGLAPEIEDLTQEILLSLFADHGRILKAWEPERGLPLDRFIGLVARRQVLSILRSPRRNPFNAQPTDPVDLENLPPSSRRRDVHFSTEARQSVEQLEVALRQRLSPAGLDMFQRLFVEEQSVSDISRHTGLSVDCVYQWRARIKKAALEFRTSLRKSIR